MDLTFQQIGKKIQSFHINDLKRDLTHHKIGENLQSFHVNDLKMDYLHVLHWIGNFKVCFKVLKRGVYINWRYDYIIIDIIIVFSNFVFDINIYPRS